MNRLLCKSGMFLKRNSSTILSCVGAIGVVATAVTAVKATPKALSLLEEAKKDKDELTTLETIQIAGPAYIPSIAIGTSTIACILGANALNKRHQASLMSAYALLDSSYKEYKNKVRDIYGIEGHNRIVEKISEDKFKNDVFLESNENKRFFDFFSLQFFESTLDDIHKAEQHINDVLQSRGYVSLGEFYEEVGLQCTDVDCALGWSKAAGCDYIEFIVEENTTETGEKQYILIMSTEPSPNYYYY